MRLFFIPLKRGTMLPPTKSSKGVKMESNHNDSGDTSKTLPLKAIDGVLIDFVTWANKGITQGITISVKGVVYTGELIGGAAWCDLMIEQASRASSSKETIEALTSYYDDIKKSAYSTDEHKDKSVNFLHLKDARIVTFNNISDFATNWRFDIGEIDGFSVGSLSKN